MSKAKRKVKYRRNIETIKGQYKISLDAEGSTLNTVSLISDHFSVNIALRYARSL